MIVYFGMYVQSSLWHDNKDIDNLLNRKSAKVETVLEI